MSRTVVFVHGTGVRGVSYAQTYRVVRAGFLKAAPGVTVQGCYWGDAEGAQLLAGGASIPGYHQAGGRDPDPYQEQLALWAVLHTDPWYELRLICHLRRGEPVDAPPGRLPPGQDFLRQLRSFTPSPQLRAALAQNGLDTPFDTALTALRAAPELRHAAELGAQGTFELRRAIARGLLAYVLTDAEEAGAPALDGHRRDALLLQLSTELRAEGRAVPSVLVAMPLRAISWATVRRRGQLADLAMAASGDVLRYQAHGEGLRSMIRRTVEDAPGDKVTLVGHSLGGVACLELLALQDIPRVDRLITVGSQAPYLYEIGALASLRYPQPLPASFPEQWLNLYDPNDMLAYVGRRLFDRVHDHKVDTGRPFPQSHSAYWRTDAFWKAVAPWAR